MADNRFIHFYDKLGDDMNLGPTSSDIPKLGSIQSLTSQSFTGKIFFERISVGLIETQHMFLLQEVKGPTSSFELKRLSGSVNVTSGSPFVTGVDTRFDTELVFGQPIRINGQEYTVGATPTGATSFMLSSSWLNANDTTDDFYLVDYMILATPRTSPGTYNEVFNVRWKEEDIPEFFFYTVDYNEDVPYIQKADSYTFQLDNGSGDAIDPVTKRQIVFNQTTVPLQLNVGFNAELEDIYEKTILVENEKQYLKQLSGVPTFANGKVTYFFTGTASLGFIQPDSAFELQGMTGVGATSPYYTHALDLVDAGITGSNTYVTFIDDGNLLNVVGALNFTSFYLSWKNTSVLAEVGLYGESVGEDERFRLVLENFGRKVNHTDEYIFRDSDIHEDLPDYELLNRKRKELLLEGDNIYPYLGSYKALIGIIDFFGYNDVRIKEYFLNVDKNSTNFDKFLHLLVPRDEAQRKQVKHAWQIVPSKTYKKTALFGLFFDINKTTDEVDQYGIPEVVDAFDFSPEEVLIKLFGLKELLKKEFLPLNARIYDITGEGVYFERVRVDSWADNMQYLTLNLGRKPKFSTFPEKLSYIADLRRIDDFYVRKFTQQGLSGFLGLTATDPSITPAGYTGPIQDLFNTYVGSYSLYQEFPRDAYDSVWQYMPPPVDEPAFNEIAARLKPLPDDQNIPSGAPVLLESFFDLTWEEATFPWGDLSILGPSGPPVNINLWTWDNIGRGEYTEMRWVVQKKGQNAFLYDTGRLPIDDFLVQTIGATLPAVTAAIEVTQLGGSAGATSGPITGVKITNPGFGYTTLPNVSALGTTGATATIDIVLISEDSFILGGTGVYSWVPTFGGSGYTVTYDQVTGATVYPKVNVDPPTPIYSYINRLLNAVALPYEGEYDIALYTYDVTNNFSVDFQKYQAKARNVEFASIFKRETKERNFEDFKNVSWDEVTGPWYYPIHADSTKWEDANVSWESLSFLSFKDIELYERAPFTSVIEINREQGYVILSGDLTNEPLLAPGNFLFFTRDENSIIQEDLPSPMMNFSVPAQGTTGGPMTTAFFSGASGATTISTTIYNVTASLTAGDHILVGSDWFNILSTGPTSVSIDGALGYSFGPSALGYFKADNTFSITYTGTVSSLPIATRMLFVDSNVDYASIDPSINKYGYFDVVSHDPANSTIVLRGGNSENVKLITANWNTSTLYATWGVFSGTYAIEILNRSLTIGNNTLFRLEDSGNELYDLDGTFSLRVANYDVDYAENRVTPEVTWERGDEVTWGEQTEKSFYGEEFHADALCGFVIPFVLPGSSIQVDEHEVFSLSGNPAIASTQAGLQVAAAELQASLNEGVMKYDYVMFPTVKLDVTSGPSASIATTVTASVGATQLTMSGTATNIAIPATATATVSLGSISSINPASLGLGYALGIATVTIDHPGGTGVGAKATATVLNGQVVSYVITDPGSGYASVPNVHVSFPDNYREDDNYIWTGFEWVKVTEVNGTILQLDTPLQYTVPIGAVPLLPYQYHKQIIKDPNMFQQFYFFIHGRAKNPSAEMLSYVRFDNGMEGEWVQHPVRTYTYPLRNTLLHIQYPDDANTSDDWLYQRWQAEGSDYPPNEIPVEYSSPDKLSYAARAYMTQTLQSPFTFIDTVISTSQEKTVQNTPVVFSYDPCRMPGKKNPLWTIKDDKTGKVKMETTSKSFSWTFTVPGAYTVSLEIEDANGNRKVAEKNSFIVIE